VSINFNIYNFKFSLFSRFTFSHLDFSSILLTDLISLAVILLKSSSVHVQHRNNLRNRKAEGTPRKLATATQPRIPSIVISLS
jgi:hypothetical protein